MSEGHAYSISMANTTIVADATLIIVHTASAVSSRASRIEVLSVRVGCAGVTASQNLGILIAQKASAFGTYTSATPQSMELGGNASGISGGTAGAAATAGVDASAEGAGTVTNMLADAFNVLTGWLYIPVPESRPNLNPDTALIVKIVGTPTVLTGWFADLVYRELN